MLAGWGGFVAAYAAFLLTHAIPVRPPVRPWLVARLGPAGFGLAYSALSLAVLVWLFLAARAAPWVPLWHPPFWAGHVTLLAMALACLLLAFAAFRPNPLSFAGWRNDRFDPRAPGVVGFLRHPVLAALALWSGGHLAANGDLAHVLMFGGFAGFALLGQRLIDRRRRRELGPRGWADLAATARAHRLSQGAGAETFLRLLAGLALVHLLIALHPWLAGVPIAARFMP
ncbi:NnrU family protein [Pararhodobacter sp. SW119]|uniref:NnrU family protein n=1 Tax=Pararhodobacter sp. SW119 TaxID=2780075 RepID=UPI001AE0D524|nr:NnrU family protein [Pararhodobacter sp. SW119]